MLSFLNLKLVKANVTPKNRFTRVIESVLVVGVTSGVVFLCSVSPAASCIPLTSAVSYIIYAFISKLIRFVTNLQKTLFLYHFKKNMR